MEEYVTNLDFPEIRVPISPLNLEQKSVGTRGVVVVQLLNLDMDMQLLWSVGRVVGGPHSAGAEGNLELPPGFKANLRWCFSKKPWR